MTPNEIIEAIGIEPYYREDAGVIYCGDIFEVLPRIPRNTIDLIVTSPPYNVGMEYETILPWPRYLASLKSFIALGHDSLKDGGVMAVNLPKEVKLSRDQIEKYGYRVVRVAEEFDGMTKQFGFLPRENIIWVKAGDEGSPYSTVTATGSDNNIYIRSTCEIITLHSKNRYFYDGGTGRRGKEAVPFTEETKDIWWIRPISSIHHPCPFPIEIPHRLIRMFTIDRKYKPIICDPYLGQGTTALAAKGLNRFYIGIDKTEKYCKIAVQRLAQEILI